MNVAGVSRGLALVRELALTVGEPASVEATGSVAQLSVVIRDLVMFRAWCDALSVQAVEMERDALGTVARATADLSGWRVHLVCQVLPGELPVVSGGE